MESTPLPEHRCWKCGYEVDSATEAFGDSKPHEGDITMCINCGAIAIFTKELIGRQPTPTELAVLESDPQMTEMQIVRAGMVGDKLKEDG